MTKRISQPLAAYLTELVDASELSREEIARAGGFFSVEYLNHVLAGRAKLSIRLIEPLAKTLKRDPKHLLRIVLGEYAPDTLDAIESVLERPLLSKYEQQLLADVRKSAGKRDLPYAVVDRDMIMELILLPEDSKLPQSDEGMKS